MPITRIPSIDALKRDARLLRKAYEAGETSAVQRLKAHPPRDPAQALKHADFLHVVAQEQGFESWPRLALAAETVGLDRAAREQRLKVAVAHGQLPVIEALLDETPDLAKGMFGIACALYDRAEVEAMLAADPGLATRQLGPRTPILHLAFSRYIHARPERDADMLAIAETLVAHGADVNDGIAAGPDTDHRLSALYGAIGHAGNMALGRWLLEHGADPNDGESLYHATELGHHDGLRLLLDHGADPKGTNALLRAMDFNDHAAVEMLLAHGARADDFAAGPVGGEAPAVIPALHQAARRGCDARMVALLLDAGADPGRVYEGATAYAFARVHGNRALAETIEARGRATTLSAEEDLLAAAAEGRDTAGRFIDPAILAPAYRDILQELVTVPDSLDHIRRLVALGVPYDRADGQGITPVQIAGWNGLPDVMDYLLSLKPDLSHVNNYGGTLLTTILHGAENCPDRATRDHVACLRRALQEGVALPRQAIGFSGNAEVSAFLSDWAEAHPGQVVGP